jgi:hypothetical protein
VKNAVTFVSELVVFTLSMIAIIIFLALLHAGLVERLGWPDDTWVTPAEACTVACASGTPDAVIGAINTKAGAFAPCITQVVSRETGGTFDPHLVNPSSGAYGAPQFIPYGGVYDVTPAGRAGIPVTSLDGQQQIDQMVQAWQAGYKSHWSPPC